MQWQLWLLLTACASALVVPTARLGRPGVRQRCTAVTLCDDVSYGVSYGVQLPGGASKRRELFDLDGDGFLSSEEVELAVGKLAEIVNSPVMITGNRDILTQFELYRESLWRRWRGTVWECVWPRLVQFGLYTTATCALIHASVSEQRWDQAISPSRTAPITPPRHPSSSGVSSTCQPSKTCPW